MTWALPTLASRVAALILLASAVLVMIGGIFTPLVRDVFGDDRLIEASRQQLAFFRADAAREPWLLSKHLAVKNSIKSSHLVWSGLSDAGIAARVQSAVRRAMPVEGQIISISQSAVSPDHGLLRMTLRFEVSLTLAALTQWMRSVESQRPTLFVDRLSITALPLADPAQRPTIDVECDISAYVDQAER